MTVVPLEFEWQPEFSIYASPGFLAAVSDAYGWLGGRDEGGTLRFILPYTIVRRHGVRMVRFRVETIVTQPTPDGMREERQFLDACLRWFKDNGAHVIIPASTNTLFRTFPDGAQAVPYGSYVLDLTPPEEELWNRVHPKHRNVIRGAQKKGVQVLTGLEYAPAAYDLIAETFRRSAMPLMSRQAFDRMIRGLGNQVQVFVALHKGVVQACAVIPFSRYSAYYAYGGTSASPVTGASNLLQWEAIRHFRAFGTQRYDFCGARINPDEGSKAAGLAMFKARFGGQLRTGYMWKCPLQPLRAAIYNLGVRLLRGGDIVDQELRRYAGRSETINGGQAASPASKAIADETSRSGLQDG